MPIPRHDPVVRLPPGTRRAALLTALVDAGGPATVADLARAGGLHPNTVRAHLDVLVREGRATRSTERRGAPGRPREVYEATGAPEPAQAYAALALLLAEQLAASAADPADAGERMGRRWAAQDGAVAGPARDDARGDGAPGRGAPGAEAAVTRLVHVLRRAGFAPEVSGAQVLLHGCPIREVARAQPGVVCQAHLGLIRATLAGSDVVATRIQPFVAPDLCVASLDGMSGAASDGVPTAAGRRQ